MSILVKRMVEMERSRLYASVFPSTTSREHAAFIADLTRRAGDTINAASCTAARAAVPVEIIERDYGRDGRAWMVDPPGGLHDSAGAALAWVRRRSQSARIKWVAVTAEGRAEVARVRRKKKTRRD